MATTGGARWQRVGVRRRAFCFFFSILFFGFLFFVRIILAPACRSHKHMYAKITFGSMQKIKITFGSMQKITYVVVYELHTCMLVIIRVVGACNFVKLDIYNSRLTL